MFLFLFDLGGFKGQVRWPKGPPHLALNPPFFVFVCFSLLFIEKMLFPARAFLFNFECLPLFLLSLFLPPPFSLSLSLSLSCYFLSFFLSLFVLSFASLFLSLSLYVFLLCFCFTKRTTSKYSTTFLSILFLFWVYLALSFKSLYPIFIFS